MNQVASITEQDREIYTQRYSRILLFLRVCILLAFIGTVLTVARSVGSLTYPVWLRVSWDTMNALLSVVPTLNAMLLMLAKRDDTWKGVIGHLIEVGLVTGALYISWQNGILSVCIFVLLAILYPSTCVRLVLPVRPVVSTLCSVCKKPSQQNVCVDCERTHQSEIQRVRNQNWRARKAGEPATLTLAEWLETLERFQRRCAYCQNRPFELMEHYIPIGQGKGTTKENCVPGCRLCNAGKSNKHPEYHQPAKKKQPQKREKRRNVWSQK